LQVPARQLAPASHVLFAQQGSVFDPQCVQVDVPAGPLVLQASVALEQVELGQQAFPSVPHTTQDELAAVLWQTAPLLHVPVAYPEEPQQGCVGWPQASQVPPARPLVWQ